MRCLRGGCVHAVVPLVTYRQPARYARHIVHCIYIYIYIRYSDARRLAAGLARSSFIIAPSA